MTPVEKLQAAIDKLEALKSRGTDGPWTVKHWDGSNGKFPIGNDVGRYVAHYVERVDAERIVTLHRTIDPILEILRKAEQEVEINSVTGEVDWYDQESVALAESILGAGS